MKYLRLYPKNNRSKKQEFIEQAILQDQVSRMKLAEEKSAESLKSTTTPQLGGFHQQFDSRSKRVDQLFNTRYNANPFMFVLDIFFYLVYNFILNDYQH